MPAAVITGGSRGFGLALGLRLVDEGWSVVVCARDEARLSNAYAARRATGRVRLVVGDIQNELVREAMAQHVESLDTLDLLVNNASVLGASPLPALRDYPLAMLEEVFRVNTLAPLALVQRLLPYLVASRGTVVDVSSDAAVEAYEGWGGYGASKAALDQLSAVLALEEPALAVYAFDPGDMRTAMHQEAYPGDDISDRPEPETVVPGLLSLLHDRPPSGRYRASELAVVEPA
jgi:NAD(P)-dependent dehydrogenase (short-subunit alcohol dehydrogenase family)